MAKDKYIKMSKRELLEEHERIVPELKRAGLKKEAKKQERELKGLKRK